MTASSFVDATQTKVVAPRLRIAIEFFRYFFCSMLAFAADFSLFTVALRLDFGYPLAALIGFAAGLLVAYRLSISLVFSDRKLSNARYEFMVFAGIGIIGLVLTEGLLYLFVSKAGVNPSLAKLLTAGTVFISNFALRKVTLFTPSNPLKAHPRS